MGSKAESQLASLWRAGWLPLLLWGCERLSPRSWAFPLLTATSQPASSHLLVAFFNLCQRWARPGFAASHSNAGCLVCHPRRGGPAPSLAASQLSLAGGSVHTLPRPWGQGPRLASSAVTVWRHLLGPLETLLRGSCRSGSESRCLRARAARAHRPPLAPETPHSPRCHRARGRKPGCPYRVASLVAGRQPHISRPSALAAAKVP